MSAKPLRPRIPGLLTAFCIYSLVMLVVLPVPQYFYVAELPSWLDLAIEWQFRLPLLIVFALQHLGRIFTTAAILSRTSVTFRILRVYLIATTAIAVVTGISLMDPCAAVVAGKPFLANVIAVLDNGQAIGILLYPAPLCAWWVILEHSRRVRRFRDAIAPRAGLLPVDRPGEYEEPQREK
jgi:hypothetical protein